MMPSDLWNTLAAAANVTLDESQHEKLWRYIDLLLEANRRMNLTRIATRDAAAAGHVADALTLLPHLPPGRIRVADVGSGGGVPGIVLAVARPDTHLVLIESTRKKAQFLTEVIGALGLTNAAVLAERAEAVGRSDARESFDVAVARAVGTLDWLVEWCLPLVKVGGAMLAMKGPKVQDELPAARRVARLLGGRDAQVHPVSLPGMEGHVIVRITKSSRTSNRYPRDPTGAKGKAPGQ